MGGWSVTMKRQNFVYSVLNGIIQGGAFVGLPRCIISFLPNISVSTSLILSVVCAIFVSCVFLLFLWNVKRNKTIIWFCLNSTLFYGVVVVILLYLIQNSSKLFPKIETNSADGMLILMALGVFFVFSAMLKIALLLFVVTRNIVRKTGGSSLS